MCGFVLKGVNVFVIRGKMAANMSCRAGDDETAATTDGIFQCASRAYVCAGAETGLPR